jgi:hypothetical protein
MTTRQITHDQFEELTNETRIEARKVELENFLSVITDNHDLLHYLCDFGIVFNRDGIAISQNDLTMEEKEGRAELQDIMIRRIMSGEQKVNGEKRHWHNGFMGSRWYDAQTISTTCRAGFYSKTDDERLPKKYRIIFSFENRKKRKCDNPVCDNRGIGYKKCSLCKWSYYCSSECQQCDWKEHKKRCDEYKEFLSDD